MLLLMGCSGDDGGQVDEATGESVATAGGEEGSQDSLGAGDATAAPEGDQAAPTSDATAGRLLIKRASVTLSSDDPDATVAALRRLAQEAGGFVSGTQLERVEGLLSGSLTIRVPAEALDGLLAAVADTGAEVIAQETSTEDVTIQVTDIESQLRNLRAVEQELLVLLGEAREAGGTEEVLRVFDRVSSIRGEIETLQGRSQQLTDLVSLSTVTVTVRPSPALVQTVTNEPGDGPLPWNPGNRASSAWDAAVAAMRGFVNALISVVVYVIPVALVWLSPLLLLGAVVLWWRRRQDRPTAGPPAAGQVGGPPAPPVPAAPDSNDSPSPAEVGDDRLVSPGVGRSDGGSSQSR